MGARGRGPRAESRGRRAGRQAAEAGALGGSLLRYQMMVLGKISRQLCSLKKLPWSCDSRYFWEWLNTVFNKAASEWLLRCGAMVRYHGQERWMKDYNNLPVGPLDKYKIQAIDATDSCIMGIGLEHMTGLEHVEKIKLCKCHYIEDKCLQRLSQLEKLQKSLLELEIISCGNVTDNGIAALRHFRNLKYLFLSDLPGVKEKENLIQVFKTALPSLEFKVNL
ncbi:ATP synthase subunit s, mitochondrial isoform X2 [Nannospalax galili]|uniref:ATP synthase subunit s, mitochondrial isoform X2 n=1 Tax=Nannospalax galili TaxID=1026970 RepID=UPI00111BE001|nr:ATP synthase subunit s, mitochondrial isoform X2 [Nannospalax galili]